MKLTEREKLAINGLRALSVDWPASLWLFSRDGVLAVMRVGDDGKRIMVCDSYHPGAEVAVISGIPSDGGN